jgi:LuxR family transcriptional regulator, quorum-sensing system regulator BjaR1
MGSAYNSYFQQAISSIELIEETTSNAALANVVQLSAFNLGFPTVVMVRTPSVNESFLDHLYLNTRDDSFTAEYFSNSLAQQDPVVDYLQDARQPFKWSDAYKDTRLKGAKQVHDLAAAYGMMDGYVISVAQMGSIGVLSASIGKEKVAPDACRALQLIGTYALSKFQINERNQLPLIRLHKREQECLQWIAIGKTDQEIATIIGLSPNTVRMYVEQAKDKLGTSNRTAAVVKAIRHSAISI